MDIDAVETLITDSLQFGGLILIPGIVGSLILGGRILRIYGPEFQQGTAVLSLLMMATLIYAYQKQLLTSLNALDRPDLAFRVNLVFITFNIVANVVLIQMIGWIGAALATVASALLGMILALRALSGLVKVSLPYSEVSKQLIAAGIMGGVVALGLRLENTYNVLDYNVAVVCTLVLLGASVYGVILLVLSPVFRNTVRRNLPHRVTNGRL